MSVRQDRFTFFGVLIAVVIVVIGYLQLSRLYPDPVSGRDDSVAQNEHQERTQDRIQEAKEVPPEGESQP
jgi:Tfp pilus assembly protein PilV